MKIATGTFRNGSIQLDSPMNLPDAIQVKVVVQAIGPDFDENQPVEQSEEEIEHVKRARPNLGKIIREECG